MTDTADRAAPPTRILLIEDSDDNALVFQLYLRNLPVEVDVAKDGRDGVEKFASGDYSLVVLDILMPIMDGFEAARRIRALERDNGRPHTPMWAITAHATTECRDQALAAGCDGYLTKPIPKMRFLEVVAGATGCL